MTNRDEWLAGYDEKLAELERTKPALSTARADLLMRRARTFSTGPRFAGGSIAIEDYIDRLIAGQYEHGQAGEGP